MNDTPELRVQPDPPDERDLTYPPDLSVPDSHYESDDRVRLRQVLSGDGVAVVTEALIDITDDGSEVAAPHDDGTTTITSASFEYDPSMADLPAGSAVTVTHECASYREFADTAWRQRGEECTGFALAAIANYHLRKDLTPGEWNDVSEAERQERTVSRRMLYEMAQVYDQSDYAEGSTLRGALKGWCTAGVAADQTWPYEPDDEYGEKHGSLTMSRVLDAVARPGGTYLRVDQSDRGAMQDALGNGFPLFASAKTHVGWFDLYMPDHDVIARPAGEPLLGAHAFVIYGFDDRGWLIHNSWGPEWGDQGFAVLPYDDFDATGQDVWFVLEPRRVRFVDAHDTSPFDGLSPTAEDATSQADAGDMWLHRLSIGDDGGLSQSGRFGMNPDEVGTLLYLFRQRTLTWKRRRLAIFSDGGYWDADDTLAALRPFCDQLMAEEIYPIFLVWDTPWYDGMRGWLYGEADASPDAPFTVNDLDGDDAEAPGDDLGLAEMWGVLSKFLVAQFSAPRIWRQLHANARAACVPGRGAAWILADRLAYNLTKASFDVHVIGHGTGDFLLTEIAGMLGTPIESCQLWAPISTMEQFSASYEAMLSTQQLCHLHVITLGADAERADRTGPVPGSIVQLASEVLEVDHIDLGTAVEDRDGTLRWTPPARPLLGLESTLATDPIVASRRADGSITTTSIASGTHTGLLTDRNVWQATIDSMTATSEQPGDGDAAPDTTRPAPSDSPSPRPDPRPDPAGGIVDPLNWVIARSSSD